MNREKQIFRTTLVGSVANLLLVVFKFIAGIVGHSAAMIADAVHSLSDFITDIIVIIFVAISGKPEDEDHDYGHGKYETLATAVIGIILFFVGVGILISGIKSIIGTLQGEPLQTPSLLALIAAVISIVVKEVLYHYTVKRGKALGSSSVVANAWHHRSDAIFLGEQWRILDPIAAVIVSLFIIKVAVELFKPCIEELLERSLPAEMEQKILDIILSTPQVSSPHHLRTRRIGSYIAIEVHIRMDGQRSLSEAHQVASDIERRLKAEFGESTHIGIHMEPTK